MNRSAIVFVVVCTFFYPLHRIFCSYRYEESDNFGNKIIVYLENKKYKGFIQHATGKKYALPEAICRSEFNRIRESEHSTRGLRLRQ